MFRRLIAWSINHSQLVIGAAGVLVVLAGALLATMPVDVFPELNAPTVVVLTESGGLTAEEVEQQVTFPIEATMTGLPGVRRVRSASATSLSLIWVEFDWSADIYRARQLVGEKLAGVRESLPGDAHAELGPVSSIAGEIMLISVSSPEGAVSPIALRELAEFRLRPGLLAVPGVSQVVAIGGRLPEYQVHVDHDRLLLDDLSVADVISAVRQAHETTSGGYLPNVAGEEQPVQQRAQLRSVADLSSTLVRPLEGAPLRLGDIADVTLGGAPRRGNASSNGSAAVVLSIQRAPDVNTLALTERIDTALDQLEPNLPAGVVIDRNAFRQSRFIQTSVDNLSAVVVEAIVIVALIVMLFLLNARATLVTLTALPLSLGAAVVAMWALGMSINVMTIGGLAVAIGALVDDAIIDVENVLRRVRENNARPAAERRGYLEVVFTASDEIRSSVVFATVIICAVFLPLLALEGLEGRFFRPLGFAYIVAVLASLLVALTVTPALCKHLFRRSGGGTPEELSTSEGTVVRPATEGRTVAVLKSAYRPILGWALLHRVKVAVATVGLTAAAVLLVSTFGSSFLPEFNEGSLTVFVTAPPGTSLDESDRLARGIERGLTQVAGVQTVTRRTGRAERDEHAEPVWSSELDVVLKPGESKAAVRERVDRVLASVRGVSTTVGQPIEHRLSHILSGTPAAIAVNIYGDDLPTLRGVAKQVEAALDGMEGARDVAANREVLVTTLPIVYDRMALARFGLTPAAAAKQVGAALAGAQVASVRDGAKTYDAVVRLTPASRRHLSDVRELVLTGADGQLLRLRDVARVVRDRAPYLIARQDGRRKAVVSANVAAGYNLGHLVSRVKERVGPIAARAGVSVAYGGQFQAQQSAASALTWAGLLMVVLVGFLLNATLGSWRATLLVAINLPLALIGGVIAIFIADSPSVMANLGALVGAGGYDAPVVSVASLVGFVTLFGIAVRNGILLVNHYEWLQRHEGLDVAQAVRRGSEERLVPVVMTALTAILGLVPLVVAGGEPGSELLSPLAVVVLGGLLTSTLLNLFLIPLGYEALFGRAGFQRRRAERLVLEAPPHLSLSQESSR